MELLAVPEELLNFMLPDADAFEQHVPVRRIINTDTQHPMIARHSVVTFAPKNSAVTDPSLPVLHEFELPKAKGEDLNRKMLKLALESEASGSENGVHRSNVGGFHSQSTWLADPESTAARSERDVSCPKEGGEECWGSFQPFLEGCLARLESYEVHALLSSIPSERQQGPPTQTLQTLAMQLVREERHGGASTGGSQGIEMHTVLEVSGASVVPDEGVGGEVQRARERTEELLQRLERYKRRQGHGQGQGRENEEEEEGKKGEETRVDAEEEEGSAEDCDERDQREGALPPQKRRKRRKQGDAEEAPALEAWLNVSRCGHYHGLHHHATSAWSGVYWAQGPSPVRGCGHSGGFLIQLKMDHLQTGGGESQAEGRKHQEQQLECICKYGVVEPRAGVILLFRGWLPHAVFPLAPPAHGDQAVPRVSASFNAG